MDGVGGWQDVQDGAGDEQQLLTEMFENMSQEDFDVVQEEEGEEEVEEEGGDGEEDEGEESQVLPAGLVHMSSHLCHMTAGALDSGDGGYISD